MDTDDDNDGVSDLDEFTNGTNPLDDDSDDDGLNDEEEIKLGTNPTLPDTDGDGSSDSEEIAMDANRGFNTRNGWIDMSYYYRRGYQYPTKGVNSAPPDATDDGGLSIVADHFTPPWSGPYNHKAYKYNVLYLDGSVSFQTNLIAQNTLPNHYQWTNVEIHGWPIFDR